MIKTPHLLVSFLVLCLVSLLFSCRAIRHSTGSSPITHEQWDVLLKKHVDSSGLVHYAAFQRDSTALNAYLKILENAHPDDKTWSRDAQMAYWINAYNAFTVKLIIDHYPVASIKDIKRGIAFVNSVWDIKFIKIEGFSYDLNNIEHNILRKVFKDARIHAAINCASYSCPKLSRHAYTAADLDRQLTQAMTAFVNDPNRNKIQADKAEISPIFKWFKGDFERNAGSVRKYINQYSRAKLDKSTNISYLDYNWQLNDAH